MHCPECGFVNAEGANYCQKCGAFLGEPGRAAEGDTTEVYQVDETGELQPVDLEEVTGEGATLVIRSGGGRAGEAFNVAGERMTIGRSPDAEVFLDDVTVSRNHALLVRRRDGLYIDDLGSLNGTYVNRRRIESHKLAERRRAAGRQVQADVPGGAVSTEVTRDAPPRKEKALTIGAVCKQLEREFPDISISKIRYLEDQKLLDAAAHAGRLPALRGRPTSTACARSCACSATSSCRCG